MTGRRAAGTRRAQVVARFLELRPVVLARILQAPVAPELRSGPELVTDRQLQALAMLPGAGLTMREMATCLGTSGATASALADRLVAQGLADRHADPADRRIVRLVPSAAGMALAERYREVQRRAAATLLERLSDEQAAALLDIMEALAAGEAGPPDAARGAGDAAAPSGEPALEGT